MLTGRSNCGAVMFETKKPVSDIHVCHCSICRRYTGSNGIPVVVIENEPFKWVKGRSIVRTWKKLGADWESNFCSVCSFSLPGKNNEAHMFVPAWLLPDDVENLKVAHHISVGSKANWDEIGDAGSQHDGPIFG